MSPITNINELNYDDEVQPEPISEICFQIFNSETNNYVGTAFLIRSDGFFLSAGHNFKEDGCPRCAFFKSTRYEILEVYKEYSVDNGKDLFLGKLIKFNKNINLDFTLSEMYLELGSQIFVYGFNSRRFNTNIYLMINDCMLYAHKEEARLISLEEKKDILNDVIKSSSRDNSAIVLARLMHDPRLQNENESLKFLDALADPKYSGISGGPVYFDNKIYGVFIADMFVSSRYIIEIIRAQ